MPITERTLKKWRREALEAKEIELGPGSGSVIGQLSHKRSLEYLERMLRMTQELLDQHLMRKVVK